MVGIVGKPTLKSRILMDAKQSLTQTPRNGSMPAIERLNTNIIAARCHTGQKSHTLKKVSMDGEVTMYKYGMKKEKILQNNATTNVVSFRSHKIFKKQKLMAIKTAERPNNNRKNDRTNENT